MAQVSYNLTPRMKDLERAEATDIAALYAPCRSRRPAHAARAVRRARRRPSDLILEDEGPGPGAGRRRAVAAAAHALRLAWGPAWCSARGSRSPAAPHDAGSNVASCPGVARPVRVVAAM